jgi:beta-xylosidase
VPKLSTVLRVRRVFLALLSIAAVASGLPARTAGAASISVVKSTSIAFGQDAPDPFIVRHGSTYYAFTTGTTWGNHIGILQANDADGPFQTITGQSWGSSAFPSVHWSNAPAAWQVPGTQLAPAVLERDGTWILYYSAQRRTTGEWCLAMATASQPQGPYVDRTGNTPWYCLDAYGGAVDPNPYVGSGENVWLHFKSNTGSRAMSARLWAMQLNPAGTAPTAAPRTILTQNSAQYPWEKTIENPQMVVRDGRRYLFYSGNLWNSSGYAMNYAVCDRVDGGCRRARSTPFLKSYGAVKGPGGGAAFSDSSGSWWLTFHAWGPGCYSYSCGGKRKLYVKPLTF